VPDDTLLTPAEAAARLGVTTKTLRRWALTGKLAAEQLPSGQLRYRAHAIDAALSTPEQAAS
jgi:excisionase family DNA binding protein